MPSMELGRKYDCLRRQGVRHVTVNRLIPALSGPNTPMLTYVPGREGVDVVTSATEQYFASRGLLYTYRGGRRVDTTFLHIREWMEAIRGQGADFM
jgi:hypothetical protein